MAPLELHEVFAPREPAFAGSPIDVIAALATMAFIIGGSFWIGGIFG